MGFMSRSDPCSGPISSLPVRQNSRDIVTAEREQVSKEPSASEYGEDRRPSMGETVLSKIASLATRRSDLILQPLAIRIAIHHDHCGSRIPTGCWFRFAMIQASQLTRSFAAGLRPVDSDKGFACTHPVESQSRCPAAKV